MHSIAAPSVAAEFLKVIEGVQMGPSVGSCGTAAWRGEPVIVDDIAADPLWDGYRAAALPLGIRACWSSPIWNQHGAVIGTFAFYYLQTRGPTEFEKQIVAACVHLCALAIDREERLNEARRAIFTDALTGLGNRACFNDATAHYDRAGSGSWALMLIDVDDLKVVNDTFGHRAGDSLIRCVAERISLAAPAMLAFRLGGDEFAVLIEGADATRTEGIARAILDSLETPAPCDGHMLIPTVTMGIAVREGTDQNSEAVRQNADLALYHAKETRRGGFVQYVKGFGSSITRRMTAIRTVRAALAEDRIEPFYQPVIELDGQRTMGMEALCRIRRPEGGYQTAGEFLEATSDAVVARALTERMLTLVAADARRWLDAGAQFRLVGINLSPADFRAGNGLADQVAEVFTTAGVPLDMVVVEVTEQVYLGQRDDMVAREIAALRAYGMRIALDDFGTGYASLSHLLTIPIDVIKIDKSFVEHLKYDRGSSAIINGIARICEKLGIHMVAEGVETAGQSEMLLSLGCHVGQGFHLARPMDHAAATAFLLERVSAPTPADPNRFAPRRRGQPGWPLRRAT